jgi:hypothetical protein
MSDPQQQKKLLAVLLLVLLGFSSYRLWQMTGDEAVVGARRANDGAQGRALADVQVLHLNLQDLRRERATYKPGRNPFRFGPAPAPPQEAVAPPPRQRRQPRSKPARVQPATPPPPPRPKPPPVDFSYLGSFGPEDRRIAVFIKDDEIYNALTGDVLLERFIVDKIGFESADIKFVGFPNAPETRLEAGG